MQNWYALSILALLLMGTQRFLYKVSAEKRCNTAWTTSAFMATVTLLSTASFAAGGGSISDFRYLVLIAAVNSLSFAVGTVAHIEALKHVPAAVAYPVIRLNAVIVILFSVFYFQDRLSARQVAGILLALLVMLVLTSHLEKPPSARGNLRRGLLYVGLSLLSGSIASISSKFAALHTNALAFMALSYFLGTIFSLALTRKLRNETEAGLTGSALGLGAAMGGINFVGFYVFLQALAAGPLSIVVSITGMHFVIPVLLSAALYRERLGPARLAGLLLTAVSILLLRM